MVMSVFVGTGSDDAGDDAACSCLAGAAWRSFGKGDAWFRRRRVHSDRVFYWRLCSQSKGFLLEDTLTETQLPSCVETLSAAQQSGSIDSL